MNSITKTKNTSIIVGIGASAGGLEALQTFLQHLPSDTGACYVIVQHLSPDHKSMMAELLSKHTSMSVETIENGDVPKANTICLLPAKNELEIVDNKFVLKSKARHSVPNLVIDSFFKSLANNSKENAIGVVLSGTGSDGSSGLRLLKEFGGLTIAQDPQSAKFDGMPNSAIRTGIVDMVLASEEIGGLIDRYINHPIDFDSDSEESLKSQENLPVLEEIFALIKDESNMDFSQYKTSTIIRRIQRRMKILYANSLSAYLTILFKEKSEIEILKKEFLIGVTQFFRDPNAFKTLKEKVIPEIVKTTDQLETIRIWVAACSTGEEVYSVAMLFLEEIAKQKTRHKLKCFATDANAASIDFAANGIYQKSIEDEIPPELLEKYFTHRNDGAYQIDQGLRNSVVFANHDLLIDPPFSKVALVTCRNVLIYFQPEAQQRILSSLYFALNKDGYTFLGSSENLGSLSSKFENVSAGNRIYKKTTNERIALTNSSNKLRTSKLPKDKQLPSVQSLMRNYKRPAVNQSVGFANEALIKEYVSPCILLDEECNALHIYGDVSPYVKNLSPGRISTNINDLINEDLSIALNSAIKKAKSDRATVKFSGLTTMHNGESVNLSLRVSYVKEHDVDTIPSYYWLIFESDQVEKDVSIQRFDVNEQARQRIEELELDLKNNKEHLQVTIEELETTNEELQAANEELMSANEELQSTNEELQSVNEELYTVNSEYQEKISEISQANGDLDEVLSLSDIGIMFLDQNLLIRRYTEAAKKYINIMESDINRPLYHISKNISYDGMLDDVAAVSKDGEIIEKEITLEDKHILRVTIYPYEYKDLSNSRGVVITFNDITRAKYSAQGMVMAYKELHRIISYSAGQSKVMFNNNVVELLLIDDTESYIEICLNELQGIKDFKVSIHIAKSVEQALLILKTKKIDLCLCDYYLENETAIDFVDACKTIDVKTPIIVMTGDANDDLIPLLLSHGLLDLIEKQDITSSLLSQRIQSTYQRAALLDDSA